MNCVKRAAALLLVLACVFTGAAAETTEQEEVLRFYDGSVFFGDSITASLQAYISYLHKHGSNILSGVTFVSTNSITLYEGSRTSVGSVRRFYYRGIPNSLYAITKIIKPEKVFILLGMNDPVGIKIDKAIGWVEEMISTLAVYSPGTQVCFFSETPVTLQYCTEKDRPEYQNQVDEYNRRLRETCENNGAEYIEIAEAMKGEDNYLNPDYASDRMCHLNPEGLKAWIRCLEEYARSRTGKPEE